MAIKHRIKFKETFAQKIAQQQDSAIHSATYDFLASPNYKEKKKMAKKKREKIFERNPDTGVIRWRYTDESPDKFGWPNYGRILKEKKMREKIIQGLKKHAEGHIAKHKANVEVLLEKTAGIAEHPDTLETIEKELGIIAEYDDQLEMLKKYF